MFCPQCGKENADGAQFCVQCGNALKQADTAPPRSTSAANGKRSCSAART